MQESIRTAHENIRDWIKEQRNYLLLGFFVLLVMVAGIIYTAIANYTTSNYELIKAMDVLQYQIPSATRK